MSEEKILHEATIIFPVQHGKVTLALKMRRIGKGKRNGYGGGLRKNERILKCAVRELFMESGAVVVYENDLEKVAICHFHNQTKKGTEFTCTVHAFIARRWVGTFLPTAEMGDPRTYSVHDLPLEEMMLADREWVPLVLRDGKKIIIEAWYGPHQQKLLRRTKITEVNTLPK